MKCLKMLGLAVVATVATTATLGADSASATVLCKEWATPCPKAQTYGPGEPFELTLEAETTSGFYSTGGTALATCTDSKIKGKTTNTGGPIESVNVEVESLSFGFCASEFLVLEVGSLEIKHLGPNTHGGLTGKGTEVEIEVLGEGCVYGPGTGVYMGPITSAKEIKTPTLDLEALVSLRAGGFLCPSHVIWKGQYLATAPDPLYFKKELK